MVKLPRLQPHAPAKPLLWIVGTIALISLSNGLLRACHAQQQQRAASPEPAPPEVITPQTLMQGGYAAFGKAQNQTHQDLMTALAWNYLQQANQQPQPLVWLRSELNNATYDLSLEQNAKLTYTEADVQRIGSLTLKISALGRLIDAFAQDTTAQLDGAIDLQPAVQETENYRSLFDSQVIERRYPQ